MELLDVSLSSFDVRIGIGIFLAYMAIDALYVSYTYSIMKKKPASAATMGAVMYFLMAFGVINYVNNFLYVIPLVAGSWLGTYIVVRYEKNKPSLA